MIKTLLVMLILIPVGAHAATYYAAPTGSGAVCSVDAPCSLSGGVGKLASGDTLILGDGTYSSGTINAIPNGAPGAYTRIAAAHGGLAVLTASGAMQFNSPSYVQIEGLKFQYAGIKYISGATDGSATSALTSSNPAHHVKLLRCAFEGGAASGNSHNLYISYAHHILMEDCWAYGLGGRYTLATQSSDELVLRRVVVRKDAGWSNAGSSDPEAALAVYNTSNSILENVIIVDCQAAYSTNWYASLFLVYNGATSNMGNSNIAVTNSIILKGSDRGVLANDSVSNATFSNLIVANIQKGPTALARSVHVKNATAINFSNLTVLNYPAYNTTSQYGVYYDTTSGGVSNSVVTGLSGGNDYLGVTPTNSDSYGNAVNSASASYNPYSNGLLYLPRTETPSTLKTANIGANVTTRIGTDGTYYGDAGYNIDTGISLWPFPNEGRIKADMGAVSARGFATGTASDGSAQTLTKYIWESLGNPIPSDIYGGTVTPNTTRVFNGRLSGKWY